MDSTFKAEAQLLYDVVDWFVEKYDSGNRVLVTYNGSDYDIAVFEGQEDG